MALTMTLIERPTAPPLASSQLSATHLRGGGPLLTTSLTHERARAHEERHFPPTQPHHGAVSSTILTSVPAEPPTQAPPLLPAPRPPPLRPPNAACELPTRPPKHFRHPRLALAQGASRLRRGRHKQPRSWLLGSRPPQEPLRLVAASTRAQSSLCSCPRWVDLKPPFR